MKNKSVLLILVLGSWFLVMGACSNEKAQSSSEGLLLDSATMAKRAQDEIVLSSLEEKKLEAEQNAEEARQNTQEAKRIERNANDAADQADQAFRTEEQAQESRKEADEQAIKADKASDKTDKN